MSAKSPQGPDNTTRNLVIGMVAFVVAIGAIFSVVSNRENSSAALPSSVSKADGYGIVFNGDLTGVPVIDVWEDFQCPVCARFEQTNGDYLEKSEVMYGWLRSFLRSKWFLPSGYRTSRIPTRAATVCNSQLLLTSQVRQSSG